MSVLGGGVGGHWSDVRSVSKKSPGPIPFLKTVDSDMTAYRQGLTRKGSYATYLDVSHPDIMEFLNLRVPTGGDPDRKCFNLHVAVNLTDAFMEAVYEGSSWDLIDPNDRSVRETVDARELWQRIIEVRFRTGEPYFFFIDTANKALPQPLKDKGFRINGSNLCVTGDQRVVTDRGLVTAKELYEEGGDLIVFDGVEAQRSSEMKLIERGAPVYKIALKNGMTHKVTSYHKVKTSLGDVACKDLKLGDRVCIQTNKGIFGDLSMEDEAFLLGLYQADGTQHRDLIMIDIWEQDFDLLDEIKERFDRVHYKYGCDKYEIRNTHGEAIGSRARLPADWCEQNTGASAVRKKRLSAKTLSKALRFSKGDIPEWVWRSNEATQWQYLRGLFYADGSVSLGSSIGNPISLSICNIDRAFLEQLQLLMRNLGLNATLYLQKEAGQSLLPDGRGGKKLYDTQTAWRLIVGNKNDALEMERNTSFLSRKGIEIEDRHYRNNSRKVSEVVSVEYIGTEDVYCINVDSSEHHFVCNGIITHNCNEITLPTQSDRSAVCCLSSLNLERFDEWQDTPIVEDLIEFLDDVIEYFIKHAPESMERARWSAYRERSLGLGAMGFHSYLQSKMIPFESAMAKSQNIRIFSHIKQKAVEATERLAKERGEYLDGVGSGRRNSHLLAVAPNANSSILLNTSPSIEPWKSNAYTHRTRAGSFLQVNPYLEALLETKDCNVDEVIKSVILNEGSVQHLDVLTDYEKAVFKTAFELDQMWIIDHAADRQEHICQSQSVNLFFPSGTDVNYVNAVHLAAHKKGLKGLYYLRTTAATSGEKISEKIERKALKDYAIEECVACQG